MKNRANREPLARSDASAGSAGVGGSAPSTETVVAELGDWSAGPGPRYRRLARAIAAAIERGALATRARLPAERSLAAALVVGRGTVVAALDLLAAEGLVVRRVGSGTYVVLEGPPLPEGREGPGLVGRLTEGPSEGLVDLSLSVIPDGHDLPRVDLASPGRGPQDAGYEPWGRLALRVQVAEMLTGWGLPTDATEVVITTGAQQALTLTAACWVRAGDTVVLDEPTYPGAPAAYRAGGARLQALTLAGATPAPSALADALAARPALAYLQPTVQSPTGAVAGPGRCAALAEVVGASGVPVVEDLSLAPYAWRDRPAPLAALLPGHPVAVVGSLSKLLWGGLRLGFVRAPAPLAARLARLKAAQDLGTSVPSQLLAEAWLADPALPAALAARCQGLRRRHDGLVAAIEARLPSWRVTPADGGLSVWVELPVPIAESLGQVARRHGVAVATAGALGVAGDAGLRLSFAPAADRLALGLERLVAAWGEVTATRPMA